MKKFILFTVLTFIFAGAFAQHSIALTDQFFATRINPAALSFDQVSGIAFTGNFSSDEYDKEDYSLYVNLGDFAYLYDHWDVDWHTFALSSEIITNLYSGTSLRWYNNKIKQAVWKEALLYRPFSFLSLAGTVDNPFKDNVQYQLGVGIRPFAFSTDWQHRLEFSADMIQTDHEWQKPIFSMSTELLDGLRMGTSYDTENETLMASVSFRFSNFSVGSLFHFDDEQEFESGENFMHISAKAFKNFVIKPCTNHLYDFQLKGSIVEKNPKYQLGPFTITFDKKMTVSDLIAKLEKLQDDERISGVVIKSAQFRTTFANYNELMEAFLNFKASGKKVYFYFESISNANYAFASAVGDEIYLNPNGSIALRGISSSNPYVKNLLDKLGIEFENFRSHPYKTAGNMLTETEMTAAEKESMQYLLDGLHAELVKMIEFGRKDKLKKPVQTIIDQGPYFVAQRALEEGLVDQLIYEDQIKEHIENKMGKQKIIKEDLPDFVRTDWCEPAKTKIALIYAIGSIHMGEGKSGQSIGSISTAKAIRKAREDKRIHGIILRIDSGGGSALASDIITREIALCKEGENAKPIVISMAGAAASGGYYIAALADKIIAQPSTITGSIGVIGLLPNLEKMYDKIGIKWSTVKTAENADFAATNRSMNEQEKEMISASIEHTYWTFVQTVAEGRDLSKEEVHKIAQGRVWTGKQAMDRGLVDDLGGMKKAKEVMKDIANLNQEIELVEFDCSDTSFEFNPFQFLMAKAMKSLPSDVRTIYDLYETMQEFQDEQVLMLMPYQISEH